MQMVLSHDRMQVIKIIPPPKKNTISISHNTISHQATLHRRGHSLRELMRVDSLCFQFIFLLHRLPVAKLSRSVGASAARLVQPPDADPDPDFLDTVAAIESD